MLGVLDARILRFCHLDVEAGYAVGQDRRVPRSAPRHDRDAGGRAEDLAAKAALRDEVWAAITSAGASRFPGAAGRIPNFTGAEAAAERLRERPEWQRAPAVQNHTHTPPSAASARDP